MPDPPLLERLALLWRRIVPPREREPRSRLLTLEEVRSRRLRLLTGGFAVLALGLLLYWLFWGRFWVATNDAYVSGNLVPLKAQVAGTVTEVRTDSTRYVRKGELVVRLDGVKTKVALQRAEAELADAVRRVETLFRQAATLRSRVSAQQAVLSRIGSDLSRYRSVVREGAVSFQLVEDTEWQLREAEAVLRDLEDQFASIEARIRGTTVSTNPEVLRAAALYRSAYLDHVRRNVVAPVSGYVAKRAVQPGDEVFPEKTLLLIIPLDYLWIEANYREVELTHVRPGQPVRVTVDLYPRKILYHGVIEGILPSAGNNLGLLPPENATGNYIHIVERVPVRIRIDPKELREHPLRPGLSCVTRIDTWRRGRPVLEPLTEIPPGAFRADYQTSVYDEEVELRGAAEEIRRIIDANRMPPVRPVPSGAP
ncbi:HlyD family secretion protein [Methylacidimicrobium tartarophylax]|uniref:Putative multidrug resistance protein EmrK n=1 Tax=Methylacidimicrobium tartarophylax TaxID=1041768 RepID=A0A5E6MBX9_9BACT|nr:efflux RND transporter periplasmic adaptor subunit [Methylacidimicrobium tartarophylax]VVM07042.1 putative multidrug resistance protein EmrK [Methylacidimicrobium tartarophylax]